MEDNKVGSANEPEIIFLNHLRASGVTNMFGAVPYLIEEFPNLDKRKAKSVLTDWMKNYEKYKNIGKVESWSAPNVKA